MTSVIAVLGSGMTGAACAATLKARGLNVVVIDKGRRPGGRMSTRVQYQTAPERYFDHGCSALHCRTEPFQKLLNAALEDGTIAPWQPRTVYFEEGRFVKRDPPSLYVGTPDMPALIQGLLRGIEVRQSTEVVQLLGSPGAWRLLDAESRELGPFRAVVMTFPPRQSLDLMLSYTQWKDPSLLEFCHKASSSMQSAWSVMLDGCEDIIDADYVVWNDSIFSRLVREGSKPQRSQQAQSWVIQMSPRWTEQHLDFSAERIANEVLHALAREFYVPLKPSFAQAHRWRYAFTSQVVGRFGAVSEAESIAVGGDWCIGTTAEAAFLSGTQMANALVDRILHQAP